LELFEHSRYPFFETQCRTLQTYTAAKFSKHSPCVICLQCYDLSSPEEFTSGSKVENDQKKCRWRDG